MQAHKGKAQQQQQSESQHNAKDPQSTNQKGEKQNPLMQMLQNGGSWVADKYQKAAQNIGERVQNIGNAASEWWDVVSSSRISIGSSGLDVKTDLNEVVDLLPADIGLMLNKEAENEADVQFQSDGTILISADSLQISSVNIKGLQLSNATLQGVHIQIKREKNGLIPKIDPDKSQVSISIDSVVGENIRYQTDKGLVGAQQVEVLNLSMTGTGKQAPFDGAPAGNELLMTSD